MYKIYSNASPWSVPYLDATSVVPLSIPPSTPPSTTKSAFVLKARAHESEEGAVAAKALGQSVSALWPARADVLASSKEAPVDPASFYAIKRALTVLDKKDEPRKRSPLAEPPAIDHKG